MARYSRSTGGRSPARRMSTPRKRGSGSYSSARRSSTVRASARPQTVQIVIRHEGSAAASAVPPGFGLVPKATAKKRVL